MKRAASPWIRAIASAIHGRGVQAACAIPDGTHIVEYTGERITKAEAKRREQQRLARLRRGGDGSVYIFDLNRGHDLDGRTRRNVARLINHSCAPNCRAETTRGRIWIIARRDIAAGEELTFDYGFPYAEWRLHPCRCGAKRCPGFIVNAAQRWRVRRLVRAARKK
jgi:SET domain-containing protein